MFFCDFCPADFAITHSVGASGFDRLLELPLLCPYLLLLVTIHFPPIVCYIRGKSTCASAVQYALGVWKDASREVGHHGASTMPTSRCFIPDFYLNPQNQSSSIISWWLSCCQQSTSPSSILALAQGGLGTNIHMDVECTPE